MRHTPQGTCILTLKGHSGAQSPNYLSVASRGRVLLGEAARVDLVESLSPERVNRLFASVSEDTPLSEIHQLMKQSEESSDEQLDRLWTGAIEHVQVRAEVNQLMALVSGVCTQSWLELTCLPDQGCERRHAEFCLKKAEGVWIYE